MALWGNNNNIDNVGEITACNYATKTLTGSGTSFGETGSAQVGDVLKIGLRGPGVGATYYGDVVITSIASTLSCSFASTESLINQDNGDLAAAGFAGTSFYATQQPKFALADLQGDRYRNVGSDFESDSESEGELRYSEDDWADADLSGVYALMSMDPTWVPPLLRV